MTLGDVAKKARFLTNTDTSSYTDAELLIDINIWYQKVVTMIFASQDESDFDDQRATNYPEQTTPMIASQRDYPIPVTERMLKIKRVDVTWDGTTAYRATPFDTGNFPEGIKFNNASSTDTNFDQNFIKEAPRYDIAYNSVWIMPMPSAADVAAGATIRIEWERNVTPFVVGDYTSVLTDSTVVPGFDAPFHPILAYGAAGEKAISKQLPQLKQIGPQLVDWEARIRQEYSRKQLDRILTLTPAYDNNYGR